MLRSEKVGRDFMEPTMTAEDLSPTIDQSLVDAMAERIADIVYKRLRAEVLMLDDALISEDELAEIMRRNPEAVKTWARIQFGPSHVRIAGSRKRHYRIGAVRHYLDEVRAGALHAKHLIEMQNAFDLKAGRLTAE